MEDRFISADERLIEYRKRLEKTEHRKRSRDENESLKEQIEWQKEHIRFLNAMISELVDGIMVRDGYQKIDNRYEQKNMR